MIKLENCEVLGWEHAIRGMRNPMNSWEKSDSYYSCCSTGGCHCEDENYIYDVYNGITLGENDLSLMTRLAKNGPVHAKYRRMITVYVDITAPLYWWKEFDTYKVGTVANSCSTMHKIYDKEFTLEDFSCEHLTMTSKQALQNTIDILNQYRLEFINFDKGQSYMENKKDAWWQMIQLLPSSYNQKRTVMLNYEVMANIYESRKNHKLDEWKTLCEWIESLPYSKLITGKVIGVDLSNGPDMTGGIA